MSDLTRMFNSYSSSIAIMAVLQIIAVILGLAAGIVIFIIFMPKSKRERFRGNRSLLVIHDFLNFKSMISTWFCKLFYIIAACVMTLSSIVSMFSGNFASFILGLIGLVGGNILVRALYEIFIVIFKIHENLNAVADKITERPRDEVADVDPREFFKNLRGPAKPPAYPPYGNPPYGQPPAAPPYGQPPAAPVYPPQPAAPAPATAPDIAAKGKVCSKCGSPLEDGSKFCPVCGQAV